MKAPTERQIKIAVAKMLHEMKQTHFWNKATKTWRPIKRI